MLGPPHTARDQSRLSRWHMRSSVLVHKSGSGPLAQSGTDGEIRLLARVAAGEEEAFRGLVDRHLPTVLAIARRMLRDDAEAEDVAQETKLRLWRNAAGLELGPNEVGPGRRRVAANLCIDPVGSRSQCPGSAGGAGREHTAGTGAISLRARAWRPRRRGVAGATRAATSGDHPFPLRGHEPD